MDSASAGNGGVDSKRRVLELLRAELELDRSSFLSHWKDLAVFASPRRARFSVNDTNRGDRRNQAIINSTASLSLRTLRSGMMGGITSPARPWFRLSAPDPDLGDQGDVKLWLDQVSTRMTAVFLRSNLYNVLPIIYGDMGQFATAAMLIEEDDVDVVRFYAFPVGTYFIATNEKGQVDTFIRDHRMTVKQLVNKFGFPDGRTKKQGPDWTKFSTKIRNHWENNQREVWIDICHAILPNDDYEPGKLGSKFKEFSSIYYERGSSGNGGNNDMGPEDGTLLRHSGYDYFPVLCPRWEVSAEDAYGTSCPGMDALGDIRQLQTSEKRKAQVVDKSVNPPMIAPTSMRNSKASLLPGDVTYADVREGQQGFRSVFEMKLSVVDLQMSMNQVMDRIKKAYFEDLFLMMVDSDRRQITATEIDERKEEKLLALGPVLEQLNQDLLDPLIDITFKIMLKQTQDGRNIIPKPPQSLHGIELKVEYLSIMAQAQKVAGISGIERFTQFVVNNAEAMPGILDKVDTDSLVDVYGDMTSIPPQIIRSDDQVAQMRQQKQKAAQAQQQAELMNQQSQTAKNLAQAPIDGNNALSTLLAQSNAGQVVPQ